MSTAKRRYITNWGPLSGIEHFHVIENNPSLVTRHFKEETLSHQVFNGKPPKASVVSWQQYIAFITIQKNIGHYRPMRSRFAWRHAKKTVLTYYAVISIFG